MRKKTLPILLLLAAVLAAPASAATVLKLYNINVDWDPNGNLWHLTDKLCNMSDGSSGGILYEFQLYQGDVKTGTPIRIGGMKSAALAAHMCRSHHGQQFKVSTKKVPPGEYKIALWAGDWNGNAYEGGVKYVMERTFIKGN
jgi:hypothetical protein